jgi:hypothetical protein
MIYFLLGMITGYIIETLIEYFNFKRGKKWKRLEERIQFKKRKG